MEKNRIVKFVSFLIITCLVFQLIPNTTACVDGFQGHTRDAKATLAVGTFNTDALHIGRENHKETIQKNLIKSSSGRINKIFTVSVVLAGFSILKTPFDHRKVIRQSIPDYFNGSKYKDNHPAV